MRVNPINRVYKTQPIEANTYTHSFNDLQSIFILHTFQFQLAPVWRTLIEL